MISNPGIGWEGYTVKVPAGMDMTYPTVSGKKRSAEFYEFQEWYRMQQDPYGEDWYSTFSERFIFQSKEHQFVVGFSCSTYSVHAGWSALPNVKRNYLLRKMISWKKVLINDTEAESRQVEIGGHHGWYVSGNARPDFQKNADPVAYEGCFLFGGLKEVYWIEAFGNPEAREEMKSSVESMVESLSY